MSGHDLDSSERGDAAAVPSDDPTVQLSRGRMAAAQRSDSTTEVMSLDELMDLAASRPATSAPPEQAEQAEQPEQPVAEAYPAEPEPARPPRPPMPVVPVRSEPALATGTTAAAAQAPGRTTSSRPASGRTAREDLQRLSADAAQAYRRATEQALTWLKAGDNALIAATAAVAILLVIVVAAL